MTIKIAGLDNGKYNYDFEEGIEKLSLEKPYFGNYITKVVLNKFDDQIILEATTKINANFICDRCGSEYESNVESSYKMIYLLRDVIEKDNSVDITYISPHADKIIIDEDVRDYAILAIPMKKLCKDDCKGLCYRCGQNLNEGQCNCRDDDIDDRLKPLLKIKDKLN